MKRLAILFFFLSALAFGSAAGGMGDACARSRWHTIVSPSGKEKTGYATQKPRGIIDRIVKVHSREGDVCFDFFAGSGTLGESAYVNGRSAILIDCNPDAIAVMRKRFVNFDTRWHLPEGDGL